MYNLCMKETWEHVSVYWQQVKYQLWANCFMCWMPVLNPGLYTLRQPSRQLLCRASWPLSHDPSAKRIGITCKVSDTRYSTEPIIGRQPISHRAVDTWYWRMAVIFVWRRYENMFSCPGIRVNSHYEQIVPWTGCQYWTLGSIVWAK